MTQPLWIQIKKKVKVPTNNVMTKHQQRSDWPTLHTIEYEQSKEIFEVLGGPIRTTSEFVYLIHKDFGDGEYLCIARTQKGARFWKFLKFICDDFRKYIILPTNVVHKIRKGRAVSNKECKKLIRKINDATSNDERRIYEQELLFEEEQLKKHIEKRCGPAPYLINTPREGKLCEMEDYRDREVNEPIQNEDESSIDNEMFSKWDKEYFDGVEENDLDKEERLKEQNKEEEKVMGFWGYIESQNDEIDDDEVKDGMTMW